MCSVLLRVTPVTKYDQANHFVFSIDDNANGKMLGTVSDFHLKITRIQVDSISPENIRKGFRRGIPWN